MMRYKIISLVLLILLFNCDKLFPEDNEGPIISILKPVNFDIVNESVKILPLSPNYDIPKVDIFLSKVEPVLISDSTLIEKFKNKEDFYEEIIILDKQLIGTDTDGKPLKFLWNTTTKLEDYCCSDYPDSSVWFLTVEGYDSKNNKTQSEGIFLMVDNSASNPDSININSVMLNQDGNFIINWDRSYESDFYSYILTKSLNNDMSNNDTIFQTFNIDSISFVDSLINPLIYQYYAITAIDTFDYFTKGPIFSSSLDQHPISISIYDVKYDYDSMTVIWEKSIDSDIEQVKLLYSLSESISKDTIFTTSSLNDTIFSIREFDPTIENWFWIMSVDTFGQSTLGPGLSNVINLPPIQSNLDSINFIPMLEYELGSFDIFWEKNSQEDFISYTLFESINDDMMNSNLIIEVNDSNIVSHTIPNIDFGEIRYYQIVVEDAWQQETSSDIFVGNSNYYFNKKYDFYETNDNIYSVVDLCESNYDNCKYLISGTSIPTGDTRTDLWVAFVDSLGVLEEQIYTYSNTGETDQITSVIKSYDDNFILNTSIGSFNSTAYNPKIIKLSSMNLSILWEIDICTIDQNIECNSNKNYSKNLKELDNNNFVLTGYSSRDDNPSNMWIIQIDNNGYYLNSFHRITEPFIDQPPYNDLCDDNETFTDKNGDGVWNLYDNDTKGFDFIEDNDGFIIVGSIENNNEKDILISKYNSSLNTLLWEAVWDNPGDDEAYSIVIDNNQYIIAGYKTSENKDFVLLTINNDGTNLQEIDFQSMFASTGDDVINKIVETSDDCFMIVGYTSLSGNGDKDIYVSKIKDSFIEWEKTYGCSYDDIGYDIKETFEGNSGGFVIGGKVSNNNNSDSWLIKTNHLGITTEIICED